MGHITNPIAFRLEQKKKWHSSWAAYGEQYKKNLHNDFSIWRLTRNMFNNYGNFALSRVYKNDYSEDANNKSGESNIIKNPFLEPSMTFSHVRVSRGLVITTSNLLNSNTANLLKKASLSKKSEHTLKNINRIEKADKNLNSLLSKEYGIRKKPSSAKVIVKISIYLKTVKNSIKTFCDKINPTYLFSSDAIINSADLNVISPIIILGAVVVCGIWLKWLKEAIKRTPNEIPKTPAFRNNVVTVSRITSGSNNNNVSKITESYNNKVAILPQTEGFGPLIPKQTEPVLVGEILNKNPGEFVLRKPQIFDGTVICSSSSPFITEELKRFWFFKNFPVEYIDMFMKANFFDNFEKFEAFCRSRNLTDEYIKLVFSLNLGATSLKLIKEKKDIAGVYLLYYLLFANVENRQVIQYISKKIPILKNCRELNFFKYFQENLRDNMDPDIKNLLKSLVGQNFEKVEESIVVTKTNLIVPNEFFFLDFYIKSLGFQYNKREINAYTSALTIKRFLKQSEPDIYILLNDARKLAYDIKNIENKDSNFLNNYIRVKHSYEEIEQLLELSTEKIINNLNALLNKKNILNADFFIELTPEDLLNLNNYRESLEVLQEKYKNGEMAILEYLKQFIILHNNNVHWISKYQIAVNIPQIVTLDDLDMEKLADVLKSFIEQFSQNFSKESEFAEILITYPVPENIQEIKKPHDLFLQFYKKLFPELF